MKVAYAEVKDASLDRIAVKRIRIDYFCCHNLFKFFSYYFFYLFLFSIAKLNCKKIMAKKKNKASFGNVAANVPKICKRFKSIL